MSLHEPTRRSTASPTLEGVGEDLRDLREFARAQPVCRRVTYTTDATRSQKLAAPDGMRRVIGATPINCIDKAGEVFAARCSVQPVAGGLEVTLVAADLSSASMPVEVTVLVWGEV